MSLSHTTLSSYPSNDITVAFEFFLIHSISVQSLVYMDYRDYPFLTLIYKETQSFKPFNRVIHTHAHCGRNSYKIDEFMNTLAISLLL